jgi:isopenicillin N synthase-like dioxygenase
MASLPIVDIAPFRADPISADAQVCVQELLAACHGTGFVYVTGHGIDQTLDDALFGRAHEFFALALAERRSLAIANSAAFRGYTTLGDERTNGSADWREQLDVGPEEAAPADLTGPPWHRLRGPNQWPPSLPEMQPAVLDWMHQMEAFGVTCLRALAVGLGQSMDCFDHAFLPESDVHLKVIRYPEREAPDAEQGLGAHHDTGVLTFIAQEGLGLQVETPDGFVDAPPMPGAYIMNLGEMLQRSTSGYLRATPHRVISPAGGERISVAFFFNPRFETVFEPIELPAELAAHAPGGEHDKIDDEIHALFGENNLRTRLRSHPDVAARHYA